MESLPDPLEDRERKDILPPPQFRLKTELLYNKKTKLPDLEVLKTHLLLEGKLLKSDFLDIINSFMAIVKKEENLIYMSDPVSIIGDIHGQFYDLPKILELGGELSGNNKYLFLGDYVDRGMFSIEVVTYLYSLKVSNTLIQLNYPDKVYLLRGNHECRQLTAFFNFKSECELKYDLEVYEKIMVSFDVLPLSCLINDKFPCFHGGLSPQIKNVGSFNN